MGINDLLKLIRKDVESNRELITISDLGNRKPNIKILVDFYSFQNYLVKIILTKISKTYDNNNLFFPSGEYDILKYAFSEFHTAFKDSGINLVWIIDGAQGVDKVANDWKTSNEYNQRDIDSLNKVLEAAVNKADPSSLLKSRPLLHFSICIQGLKDAGAKVIQLLQGEADDFIANKFIKGKSFAIISSSTEYLAFHGLQVIIPKFMTLNYENDEMKLPFIDINIPSKIFSRFESFECPIIDQERIYAKLGLSTQKRLITFSILVGNDKSKEYFRDLLKCLRFAERPDLFRIAAFIEKKSQKVWQTTKIKNYLKENPNIQKSIDFCFNYYKLKHYEENAVNVRYEPTNGESTSNQTLTEFLQMKLSNFEIANQIYSIHHGVFYESIFPDHTNSITTIMADIRVQLYPWILDEKLDHVDEWRLKGEKFEVTVEHKKSKTNKIEGKPKPGIRPSALTEYGTDLFEDVWSHLEKNEPLKYFENLDLKRGFICYILRYFYQITINWKKFDISKDEFDALFITVFYQYHISENKPLKTTITREHFLGLKICPTKNCLIIFSWFMNIYFTAKYLSGGAFNLTTDFPAEDQVINGSSFYAIYETRLNSTNSRASHLDASIQDSIKALGKEIMDLFPYEYKSVTK